MPGEPHLLDSSRACDCSGRVPVGGYLRSLKQQPFGNQHGGRLCLYFNHSDSCTGPECQPLWGFCYSCYLNFNG